MKRLFSISVLLQTATIVMTLAIAAVCGVYALSALRNQEQARRVPQVLELSNNLYAALGAIRAERGRAFRLVASSRFATRADNAELDRMRAASDKILTATLAELAVLLGFGEDRHRLVDLFLGHVALVAVFDLAHGLADHRRVHDADWF